MVVMRVWTWYLQSLGEIRVGFPVLGPLIFSGIVVAVATGVEALRPRSFDVLSMPHFALHVIKVPRLLSLVRPVQPPVRWMHQVTTGTGTE